MPDRTIYPVGRPGNVEVTVTEVWQGKYEHGNDVAEPAAVFSVQGQNPHRSLRTQKFFRPTDDDGTHTLVSRTVEPVETGPYGTKPERLEIHYDSEDTGGSGEWAALYVDGKLETVGDSYHAEQKALQLAGVFVVHDSGFMRGQKQREGVAETLAEVTEYVTQRETRLAQAKALRDQAAILEAKAKALEDGRDG